MRSDHDNIRKSAGRAASILIALSLLAGCGNTAGEAPVNGAESGQTVSEEVQTPADASAAEADGTVGTEETSPGGDLSQEENGALLTIVSHPLRCEIDGIERGTGQYPELVLTDAYAAQYPRLASRLSGLNEEWREQYVHDVGEYASDAASWAEDSELFAERALASELTVRVVRADEQLFSLLLYYYDDMGGVHPMHATSCLHFDPVTGWEADLTQVLDDLTGFGEGVRDALYENYPDLSDEFDSWDSTQYDGDMFGEKLDEGSYTWTVTDEGLTLYFSPYEIASYAAGDLEVTLSYEDHPNLIQPAYRMNEAQDMESLIARIEAETEEVPPITWVDTVMVTNPTWRNFNAADLTDATHDYVTLTMTVDDRSDWLDTDEWAAVHDFTPALLPYSDGIYTYEPGEYADYAYMTTELLIRDADSDALLYDFDLSRLCNGPDDEEERRSSSTQYLRWARLLDGVLYVSVGHNGYASNEPQSNYMVAIDAETGNAIWRSDPLVSNARNFLIEGDTIICGYGFTAEPDYIYLLDRHAGTTLSQIPVRSAPEQFALEDDTLYVACYNTAYEFAVER